MSCGEKGNDDEFDPIPVLISKNSNQGKVKRILRWALTPTEAPTMSHKEWFSPQIQLPWLFPVTAGVRKLVFVTLRLFYPVKLSH